MKKNFKRFISIFLSIAIITTIIPFSVYASEETVIDETEQFVAENAEIEYEVESLRTESSKTYGRRLLSINIVNADSSGNGRSV